jgi:diketogulonate reductase-like aldo/keto reductase
VRRRDLGKSGVSIPMVGQGTYLMEHDRAEDAIVAIRAGLDAGMTHIDTAELYGSGRVEELVARAIEGRRDEVFLVSKVLPSNASRAGTLRACDKSLKRLRTDHLDLYLLHWTGHHPLAETMAAFEELAEAGKIRHFGVSNFDVSDLEEAVGIVGEGRIACNQVLYHLEERRIEHRVMPYCEAHGIAVVGYSPFGQSHFVSERGAGYRALVEIGTAHRATPRQVALAFLVRRPSLFAIPKSSDRAHVLENGAAADLELSTDEIKRIDVAFPVAKDRGFLPSN